ncbi:MAG TPA: hypothetical protein ENI87_05730 [bacterium]|nr:hypothetical protein [bacterium]
MTTPATSLQTRHQLRLLTTPHALDFGNRLLGRSSNGVLTFREFVDTAREMFAEHPEQCATYLAALVALDMSDDDEESRPAAQPSWN